MKKPSSADQQREVLHEKIIGLGEKSIRKSYYPELQRKIRQLEQEVAERVCREKELQRNYENRAVLNQLLKQSLEDISVEALCQITVEKLYHLSWLQEGTAVTIFLVDEGSELLIRKAVMGIEPCGSTPCTQLHFGECLCGLAVSTGKVQFASQIDDRHTIRSPQMSPHGHYCVPIMLGEQALGVISLYLSAGCPHDQREEDFFVSVANTLAGIIQRQKILNEKRSYKNMLSQAQKIEALGTLSGGIAHDFNNLLAPMLGYAELALRNVEPDSKVAGHVKEIVQAANRAKALVMQILTLSQKVERHLDELKPIDLEPVVGEVLGLVRASIPTTVEIVHNLNSSGGRVLVEPTHIHQVVLNLCTNAYHAMREEGGTISVSLRKTSLSDEDAKNISPQLRPGSYMLLKVSDTGMGMDKQTLERIFDPYFTTKKQGEGTGLGLSVVNGIIKSYGGNITVYSEPGLGTSFNLFLPCCQVGEDAEVERREAELQSGSESILVVDDELQVGQMTCESLESLGYRTERCQRASEALTVFKKNPQKYDLIITDMTMPKMTGLDLLQKIRKVRDDVPVILCTGFSELINEQKAQQLGFQKYLMKPVVLRDLAFVVREVLDNL